MIFLSKKVQSIDLLNNQKLILRLNLASILLMFIFLILFTMIAYGVSLPLIDTVITVVRTGFSQSSYKWLIFLVCQFLLIMLHELIHGLFFKVFHPEGKVSFGFKNGMAYATSPGSLYSKTQYTWIAIAPFLLISILLFACYHQGLISPVFFVLTATLHAAACVGDFYWIYLVFKTPKHTLVEDTDAGISFHFED